MLKTLIGDRPVTAAVLVNRRGHALTRYGVHDLVTRYGRTVARRLPGPGGPPVWKDNRDLLVFLRSL